MRWRTPRDEQLGKRRQHVFVFQLTCDGQRQALPAGLVDDREDPELAPVVRSRFNKVVRPDMGSQVSGPIPEFFCALVCRTLDFREQIEPERSLHATHPSSATQRVRSIHGRTGRLAMIRKKAVFSQRLRATHRCSCPFDV